MLLEPVLTDRQQTAAAALYEALCCMLYTCYIPLMQCSGCATRLQVLPRSVMHTELLSSIAARWLCRSSGLCPRSCLLQCGALGDCKRGEWLVFRGQLLLSHSSR